MTACNDCGGTVIEYDTAAGNGFCIKCGTVVEENTIVNEVTFGETNAGAAMVQGSFVGQGATSKKIQSIATVFRLSDVVCLAATRLYTLAVEHKFTKGRKSLNVVAVCLYVACRQKETRNYMLIDFSDLLQVNVFELGHTYLQLVQALNLRLPLVDPSHYISRFAALLEFGDETHAVAHDAVRLVQRFDRDWMTKGRRPAGICGAALLLAARMNNFRRSIEEIVQVVKIADTTLKKRLDEFKKTPSGGLTLADFRNVWLEEEMDPPAFTKAKEKADGEVVEDDDAEGTSKGKGRKRSGKKKVKRKRGEEERVQEQGIAFNPPLPARLPIDPALLNDGILAGTVTPPPLFMPDYDPNMNIDPVLLPSTSSDMGTFVYSPQTTEVDESASMILAEEVSAFLQNTQGAMLNEALDEAEQRRRAQLDVVDELQGLDEDELDRFLLTDEEVRIKERVWVELNKEYLEGIAAKNQQQDLGAVTKSRKRKKKDKPRDASTPHGSTAAESVRNLLKKNPKYSKRINYDALKDLFVSAPGPSTVEGMRLPTDEKDDGLYGISMDDKSDGEGPGITLNEEGGGVGIPSASVELPDVYEDDADGDGDEESDNGDEVLLGWEDAYEQEV